MLPIVGIGAGLVSALLFAVVIVRITAGGRPVFLPPLPIFIAALGWNHRRACGHARRRACRRPRAQPLGGIGFAVIIALPAWWIAYLALLARGSLRHRMVSARPCCSGSPATAALITSAAHLVMTTDYEAYRSVIARIIENLLDRDGPRQLIALPGGCHGDGAGDGLAAVPVGIGASFVTTITANLWLAAKAVSISGACPGPGPSFPPRPCRAHGAAAAALARGSADRSAASSASPARP
jgi:hypothetical protein